PGGIPRGVALDTAGNLYFTASSGGTLIEVPHAFVDLTPKVEPITAGFDSLPPIIPATLNLTGPLAPTTDAGWLTVTGVTNGIVSFSYPLNLTNATRTGHIQLLGQSISVTQTGPEFVLGKSSFLEGQASGMDNVLLGVKPSSGIWSSSANASWLHLSNTNQSSGSSNITFTFDANTNAGARQGSILVAGQTVSVTQAGTNYVLAQPFTAIVASNLLEPQGLALDTGGSVYIADEAAHAVKVWQPHSGALEIMSGVSMPSGVAIDAQGGWYITDLAGYLDYLAPGATNLQTVASNLNQPAAVTVDAWGSVYIAESGNNSIDRFRPDTRQRTTVVAGLNRPLAIAADVMSNLYIADSGSGGVLEWSPTAGLTTLISNLNQPSGVAVDGSGNVFAADTGGGRLEKWLLKDGSITTSGPAVG